MLFLGNKAYPDEAAWEKWISQAGGVSNAYTDTEDTCYFFDVPSKAIDEALKRWGPFFVSPLFDASSTSREVEAIESENAKNLQSDTFRLYQLAKSRADPAHPFHKFGTGNRRTLRPPDGRGPPPREALIKFYGEHYVGDRMACCVYGAESVGALERSVAKAFNGVAPGSSGSPPPAVTTTTTTVRPFGDLKVLQDAFVVESLQSQRGLTVSWILEYATAADRARAQRAKDDFFVGHVVGHEGPRSLLARLRRAGLVSTLAAGVGEDTDGFRSFDVAVELTPRGLERWGDVARVVVAEMAALSKAAQAGLWPDHCVDEARAFAALNWKWTEPAKGADLAQSLARRLHDTDDLTAKDILRDGFVPVGAPNLTGFLAGLLASEPFLTVVVPKSELPAAKKGCVAVGTVASEATEVWYQTPYTRIALDASKLHGGSIRSGTEEEIRLLFPPPNPFAVAEADVRPKLPRRRDDVKRLMRPPTLVVDDEDDDASSVAVIGAPPLPPRKFWHKQDKTFGQPRASLLVLVRTPKPAQSALDVVHARLWRSLLVDGLRDADFTTFGAYDASLAGFDWAVGYSVRGLTASFAGFDAALEPFVLRAAGAIRAFDVGAYAASTNGGGDEPSGGLLPIRGEKTSSQTNFDRAVDGLARDLQRDAALPPSTRAVAELSLLTERPKYSVPAQEAALAQVSVASLSAWTRGLWAGSVEALASGNVDVEEASRIFQAALSGDKNGAGGGGGGGGGLGVAPPFTKTPIPAPAVLVPPRRPTGTLLKRTRAPLAAETNYAALFSLATGSGPEARALSAALAAVGESGFYGSLRTQQQLGYIVQSTARTRENASSLVYLVQSSRDDAKCPGDPAALSAAIFDFVDGDLAKIVEALDAKTLAAYVEGLARNLRELPKSLGATTARAWDEIVTERYEWDRLDSEANALLGLTPADLRDFYATTIRTGGANRRPILVEVARGDASETDPTTALGASRDVTLVADDLTLQNALDVVAGGGAN